MGGATTAKPRAKGRGGATVNKPRRQESTKKIRQPPAEEPAARTNAQTAKRGGRNRRPAPQRKETKDDAKSSAHNSMGTRSDGMPVGSKDLNEMPSHIRTFVTEMLKKGPNGIRTEFAQNRAYLPKEAEAKAFQANVDRNRYRDVMCLDSTRIELKHYPTTNYIHGNMVKGGNITFICTQGPMATTLNDFWHMIWQHECGQIVMLCDIMENGREKCAPYYPQGIDERQTFGDYTVCKTRQMPIEKVRCDTGTEEQIVHSTFEITKEGCAPRTVYHRHWQHWSDRGAPQDTKALLLLRNLCAETAVGQPVVVHCSAGIGRTGTMVLLDVVAHQLETDQTVDMVANLQRLRDQRVHSVQTDVQYAFVYKAMLDYVRFKWQLKENPDILKFNTDYAGMYTTKK